MRLLLTIPGAHHIAGGAAISCAHLLRHLERDYGHECRMMTKYGVPGTRSISGFEVAAYRDLEELRSSLLDWRPDVLIGALRGALDAAVLAKATGIPCLAYFLSYEYSPPSIEERRLWSISEAANFPDEAERTFVLEAAAQVFVCSEFMQRLPSFAHVFPQVLYPEFDRNEIVLDRKMRGDHDAITGICGYRHKGLGVFLRLADAFPEQRFVLAGEVGSDIDLNERGEILRRTNVTLLGRATPQEFLAQSRVVVVPSQWPEPFGRIAVEALANGIPVLASRCGGLEEIVGDPRLLVDDFRNPTVWIEQLRELLKSGSLQESATTDGPRSVARFLAKEATRRLHETLENITSAPSVKANPHILFHDEGSRSAFSLVNAQWSKKLLADGYSVSHSVEPRRLLPDVTVHHNYSVDFMDFVAPETGYCVAVRTWDFGRFPRRWVERINDQFDQFWAYSEWIREQAVLSGVDPERTHVVPLGFDPDLHHPTGDVYSLPEQKRCTFGFVGGAVVRKGIDILLKAYGQAFTADDDVCLVVKDHSADIFYLQSDYRQEIRRFIQDPGRPSLVYIDEFLPDERLAALYRSFDVGVFPYRAEGFCQPILETMACGVPSLVPNLGPCVDYCSDGTSYLMPVTRIHLPVNRSMKLNLGFEEHIDEVDFCEVRVETLARFLRDVYEAPPEELERKRTAGIEHAHARYTWRHVGDRMLEVVRELSATGAPVRLRQSRKQGEKSQRKLEAARRLLAES